MVVCGDEVVVVPACNATPVNDVATAIDVATADNFLVAVGAVAAVVVWV